MLKYENVQQSCLSHTGCEPVMAYTRRCIQYSKCGEYVDNVENM